MKNVKKLMVKILDINDLSTYKRLVDQIQFHELGESVTMSVSDYYTNECNLDHTMSISGTQPERHDKFKRTYNRL